MKIFSYELPMESVHFVCNAAGVDTVHNNFIQIIDKLFNKCYPIIVIKSK